MLYTNHWFLGVSLFGLWTPTLCRGSGAFDSFLRIYVCIVYNTVLFSLGRLNVSVQAWIHQLPCKSDILLYHLTLIGPHVCRFGPLSPLLPGDIAWFSLACFCFSPFRVPSWYWVVLLYYTRSLWWMGYLYALHRYQFKDEHMGKDPMYTDLAMRAGDRSHLYRWRESCGEIGMVLQITWIESLSRMVPWQKICPLILDICIAYFIRRLQMIVFFSLLR